MWICSTPYLWNFWEGNDNNDNNGSSRKNPSRSTRSSSAVPVDEENCSGSLENLAVAKESLSPAPKSTDVQEDDTRNVTSVKVAEEQLAFQGFFGMLEKKHYFTFFVNVKLLPERGIVL